MNNRKTLVNPQSNKPVTLSKRLQAIARMVTPGHRVGDVGCDHGFVSIHLIEQGISPHVIAMDINAGPLARATDHIKERHLSAYIETRLSNGMAALRSGEVETVILAGMGGPLMETILTADIDKTMAVQELILQPQSKLTEFRHFIYASGYHIVAEDIVWEEDKFYPLMKVILSPDKTNLTATEYRWGPLLLSQRHPVLHHYLLREKNLKAQLIEKLTPPDGTILSPSGVLPVTDRALRSTQLQNELAELTQLLKHW
ncbi:MAG: class I SAM-dependent methyltransferase [Lachnospiraceae bacterium]|jgi:tRNA (adenine22-N1)-methyltransferase|nr:class I SAM-dependent methyltransferase [Lachnospiraceae bacterium]